MGATPVLKTYKGCICESCDAEFEAKSTLGRPAICDECLALLAAVAWGKRAQLPPEFLFPLDDANPVSCGNRGDLPKKQRVHDWRYLGTDQRHTESWPWSEELHVSACAVCGRDRQSSRPPPGMAA